MSKQDKQTNKALTMVNQYLELSLEFQDPKASQVAMNRALDWLRHIPAKEEQ